MGLLIRVKPSGPSHLLSKPIARRTDGKKDEYYRGHSRGGLDSTGWHSFCTFNDPADKPSLIGTLCTGLFDDITLCYLESPLFYFQGLILYRLLNFQEMTQTFLLRSLRDKLAAAREPE